MRKKLLGGVAAIALCAFLNGAEPAAGGEPVDISGFYIGVHKGYGEADFDGIHNGASVFSPAPAGKLDLNGLAVGAYIGFNHLIPFGGHGIDAFLVGIEGDVTFMGWEDNFFPASSIGMEGSLDLLASIRARLGVVLDEGVSLFLTGGVAFADAGLTTFDSGIPTPLDWEEVGDVLGVGFEFAPFDTDMILFRVEGLYYFFGDKQDISTIPNGDPGDFVNIENAYVVRAGITIPLGNLPNGAN